MLRSVTEKVDTWVGRHLYGNWSGFEDNTFARLALLRARNTYPHGSLFTGMPDEVVRELGSPYRAEWINSLHDAVEAAFTSDTVTTVEDDQGRTVQKMVSSNRFRFQDRVDLAAAVPGSVKEEIESYFGSFFQIDEMRAYRNFPVPDEGEREPSTLNWHVDRRPPTQIKLFIRLTDVGRTDGPTEFIDAPSTSYTVEDADLSRPTDPGAEDVKRATGPRGSAYLFAPEQALHRAGFPSDSPRDIAYFRLYPSSTPLDADWPDTSPFIQDDTPSCRGWTQFRTV